MGGVGMASCRATVGTLLDPGNLQPLLLLLHANGPGGHSNGEARKKEARAFWPFAALANGALSEPWNAKIQSCPAQEQIRSTLLYEVA